MDNTYREIRKKIVTILKSPASGGKIEDRLTKVTMETLISELQEWKTWLEYNTTTATPEMIDKRIREIKQELTINTK